MPLFLPFQANPCQHPVIILQDVHFTELESLLYFVYKGEVNIEQENLPALLRAAETLQIRGLSGASEQVKEKVKRHLFSVDFLCLTTIVLEQSFKCFLCKTI